ncbi:MAG: copper homeostasis protein CutC [Acidobacteria bacterium]|nr:copper homeostasis protein CutC [Acidobacteriota bacterium]
MPVVEAAVETLHSALAAERAGAGRIELCASLSDGGTTPSAGLIAAVAERVRIPVFVLIRSRGGGFVYADDEIGVMLRDINLARTLGIAGIVIGLLTPDNRVDVEHTRALIAAAEGLPVTFHRAFDLTRNLPEALEHLIEAGAGRVLTSGGEATASDGAGVIAALVEQAGDRIVAMAGGGIREHNAAELIAQTRVTEVHTGLSALARTQMSLQNSRVRLRKPPPDDEAAWEEVDEARMRRLVEVVQSERQ